MHLHRVSTTVRSSAAPHAGLLQPAFIMTWVCFATVSTTLLQFVIWGASACIVSICTPSLPAPYRVRRAVAGGTQHTRR